MHFDVPPGSRDLFMGVEIYPVRVEAIGVIGVIATCEDAMEVHVPADIAETADWHIGLAVCHSNFGCKGMGYGRYEAFI